MATFREIEQAIKHGVFTPPKPIEEIDSKTAILIHELESKGRLMYMKKDDGHGHLVTIGNKKGAIHLYTLGLNQVNQHHLPIIGGLEAITFPEKTLLCSEISCVNGKGIQDTGLMTSINRTTPEKAAQFIRDNQLHPLMSIFNTLMWNGEDTTQWSNLDRYTCVREHILKHSTAELRKQVRATETLIMSLSEAREHRRKLHWEGLVLYNMDTPTMFGIGEPGGKRPSIPRPEGVYKDIDKATVDFVAYDFVPSEAPSHKGAVKDFYIGLIDPATGNIIPCGKCGGGMKRDDRFTYADSKKLPVAVSVIFKYWSKYGKTIQGSIVSVREPGDKHWTQCVATKTQLEQYLSHERITLPTR